MWFIGSDWLIGTVIALGIYCIYWYQSSVNHYWKRKNVPSDDENFFLLSLLRKRRVQVWEQAQERYKKYGKICGFYEKRVPALLLSDPDLIKQILVKDFQTFPERRTVRRRNITFGKMLSSLTGEEWKRMRSILTPVFSSGKIRKLAILVNKCAKSITDSFLKFADNKTSVNLKKQFGGFTLDVIASTAFGTELDTCNNPDNIFEMHAQMFFSNTKKWKYCIYVLAPKVFRKLRLLLYNNAGFEFFRELTLKIKKQRTSEGKVRDDFLQLLLDLEKDAAKENEHHQNGYHGSEESEMSGKHNSKTSLTEDEIVAQCILFFLVGYETTGTAIAMACFLLALNPDCQECLLAEVDETWKNHEGEMDFDTVNSMKYLDAVIAETLRLYSPVTSVKRTCSKDCLLGDTGIVIPKGMMVYVPVYAMHRDPENFPEPEIFKPERFLPENKSSIKPYTYLPFGAGPRVCIAQRLAQMEIKLGLVHVLRHVSFHKCSKTEDHFEYMSFQETSLSMPKSVTVDVKRR